MGEIFSTPVVNSKLVNSTTCGLREARDILRDLPLDLQIKIFDEYISQELEAHRLVEEYDAKLESEKARGLKWGIMVEPLNNIIANPLALEMMMKSNQDFRDAYNKQYKTNKFISGMAALIVLRKWHKPLN